MSDPSGFKELADAKQFLRENWRSGLRCPCCNKWVKLNKTPLTSSMAYALILISKAPTNADGFVHVEDYFVDIGCKLKGVHGKLKHWKLLTQDVYTGDDKAHSGYWRITQKGLDFVHRKISVEKYLYLYDDRVWERSEEQTDIVQALRHHFNYAEIMAPAI